MEPTYVCKHRSTHSILSVGGNDTMVDETTSLVLVLACAERFARRLIREGLDAWNTCGSFHNIVRPCRGFRPGNDPTDTDGAGRF